MAGAAATAPTWTVVVLATGAATLGWGNGTLGSGAGVAALLLAVVLAWTEKVDRHLLKTAIGALSATALLRAPGGPLGATAAATAGLGALIVLTGLRGGRRTWSQRARLAGASILVLAGTAAIFGAIAGLAARASFERSASSTEQALSAASSGDTAAAAAGARSAARDLREADDALSAWWARPAWALPIVGAHLRAGHDIAQSAAPAVEAAAGSADLLRLDMLRPERGRIDLDRLAAAEPEVARLGDALHRAQRRAQRSRSPWLIGPLQHRLSVYEGQLASLTATSDRVHLAVQALPRLLGREQPTRWFIAVGNPAEARELGGCICDYAVVTAEAGAIRLDRAGPLTDIGANLTGRTLDGVDLPRRYVGQHPELYWQNLGGYPDLPTVATAARALWNQVAPGSPIDGVAYVDPLGLAALLELTGPVAAPPPLGNLTAGNAAQLLLRDQYARFAVQNDDRKDALHEAAGATFAALAASALPGPGAIGATLGPAVAGGHLSIFTFDEVAQRLFDNLGLSGRLPVADGRDLASLRTTNLGEDKLDAYLRRSVSYQAVVDPEAARVTAISTVELQNDATPNLPDYVVGGVRGLPRGTSLTEVAWYSGLALDAVEVDGRPTAVRSTFERGWWTHSVTVPQPPGGRVAVVFKLSGSLAATRPYRLSVAPQAAPFDDVYTVGVQGVQGWTTAALPALVPGRRSDLVVTLHPR